MNMSFMLTTEQMYAEKKDVTRRLGWAKLKPGDRFWAVEKGMGLKKGEKVKRIYECECVSNVPEMLAEIVYRSIRDGRKEVDREGFPWMDAVNFVDMFIEHMDVTAKTMVNRIEFRRV